MEVPTNNSQIKMHMLNHSESAYVSPPPYPDFSQILAVRLTFVVTYIVVMVLALAGNAVICCTVLNNRKMHTAVNYYIFSLAFCDFMVGGFVLPFKLLELTAPSSWNVLNNDVCTSMMYLQTVFVFASVLTLVAICIERYIAVVHPLQSRTQQTKQRAKRILFVVWMLPCLIASPFLKPWNAYSDTLTSEYGTISRTTCFSNLDDYDLRCFYTFLFVFMYVMPLTFIGVTCFKVARVLSKEIPVQEPGTNQKHESNRRKTAKMVLLVVLAFAICWTPYFLVSIVTIHQEVNFFQNENYFFTMLCINLFAFVNSCVNPFIYAYMSTAFRHSFLVFFRLVFCCKNDTSAAYDNTIQTRSIVNPSKISQRFKVKFSNLSVLPHTSSGSGSRRDDTLHRSSTSQSDESEESANKRFRCKMIVRYMNGKNYPKTPSKTADVIKGIHDDDIKEDLVESDRYVRKEQRKIRSLATRRKIPAWSRKCVSVNDLLLLRQSSSDENFEFTGQDKEEKLMRFPSCIGFTNR